MGFMIDDDIYDGRRCFIGLLAWVTAFMVTLGMLSEHDS